MCNHKVVNETHYHVETPDQVIAILEGYRDNLHSNIRVHYGDSKTGKDWLEECHIFGRVSRSMGPCKIPLLVHPNANGAPGMLEHCIVRIRQGRRDIYRHPKYHHSVLKKTRSSLPDYSIEVQADGKPHARFKSELAYRQWVARMGVSMTI